MAANISKNGNDILQSRNIINNLFNNIEINGEKIKIENVFNDGDIERLKNDLLSGNIPTFYHELASFDVYYLNKIIMKNFKEYYGIEKVALSMIMQNIEELKHREINEEEFKIGLKKELETKQPCVGECKMWIVDRIREISDLDKKKQCLIM